MGSFVSGKGEVGMTQNQIAYWELQEKMRSNRAQEALKSDIQESEKKLNQSKRLVNAVDIVNKTVSTFTKGASDAAKAASTIIPLL